MLRFRLPDMKKAGAEKQAKEMRHTLQHRTHLRVVTGAREQKYPVEQF